MISHRSLIKGRAIRRCVIVCAIALLAAILPGAGAQPARSESGAQRDAFASFPLDQPQPVDFDVDEDTFVRLTAREQLDQLRDWLLFTVVSDAGLSAAEVAQALYDVPSIRSGYLRPVANFEYGVTRSVYIGAGRVVVLVPPAGTDERIDDLAWVVDRHRKDTGEVPTALHIFEYWLDPERRAGQLTRRAPVGGAQLYAAEAGYSETAVADEGDLARFLAATEDIVSARIDGDRVVLGGRNILSRDSLAIAPEHVAAIWQSENQVSSAVDEFNARWRAEFDALNSRWQGRTYRTEDEKAALEEEFAAEAADLQRRHDLEWEQLAATLPAVAGTGFSLDLKYDYEGLASAFAARRGDVLQQVAASPAGGAEDVDLAAEGLADTNEVPLLKLIDALMASARRADNELGQSLRDDADAHRYQVARYDGNVQGTEVGMVMFYTDLLAKLWTIDYLGSAPVATVPDFATDTTVKLSPVYRKEFTDLPSVRLWFGADDLGFQSVREGNELLFSRNGTRIYAASSNPLQPGVEVRAGAYWAAPIEWWNDHYEEVAQFEPEYARLNEIMKWSLIVGWLKKAGRSELLGFLADVPVARDRWFPEWVRNRPDLKFQRWGEIGFYPAGYHGSTTEALPVLISEPFGLFGGDNWTLRGGVSLADEQTFAERPPLPADGDVLVRRSDLDYARVAAAGGDQIRTLDDVQYTFLAHAAGEAVVTTEVQQEDVTLQGDFGELANAGIQRTVRYQGAGLGIDTSIDEVALGELTISRTEQGFTVGWHGQELELGESLAREVSASADPLGALLADAQVAEVINLASEQNHFWVKTVSSASWLELAPEDPLAGGEGGDWQARVAELTASAVSYRLAWIDGSALENRLDGQEYERHVRN